MKNLFNILSHFDKGGIRGIKRVFVVARFIGYNLLIAAVVVFSITEVFAYRRTYTTTDGLVYNSIFSIATDNAGNKWFGGKSYSSALSHKYLTM